MTGEIGQLALCLALALAAVMTIAGFVGTSPVYGGGGARSATEGANARTIATSCATGLFVFVALAFFTLMFAFVTSDFSVLDVANNSHTAKPLIYKITGVWGNHEGSMLLWLFVLAIYSAAVAFAKRGSERLTSAALGVQGLLAIAFLLFILFTSDPFARLDPPPFEGAGLNPLLQDPGLAFHPPMLYTGYVGLSATFAYAAAALITGEADANWARAARPFILAAWIALTLGITLGSWWAYYDLGWGGFWFWDPVENASLMPWLVATALLHSTLATERTGAFRTWSLLLAIFAFSLSLIGTFLVRSGVLTSVHSFANDPERGVWMLVLIFLAIGGALALFAWRAPKLPGGAQFDAVSRETTLLLNNLFLSAAAATVFIGTLYPLVLEGITGERISVGPPYFALTFAPLFVALLILAPFGPRLGWQRGNLKAALRTLTPAFAIAVIAALTMLALSVPSSLAAAGAFALAAWVIAASIIDVIQRRRVGAATFHTYASAIAHAGLGITLLGIAGTSLWRTEVLAVVAPGDTMQVANYTLRFDGVEQIQGPNYFAQRANLDILANGHVAAHIAPEKRSYPVEGQAISDTAIRTTGFEDLYVALGDDRGNGRWVIRAYANPLAPFIWFGGAIMALGGFASLIGRLRRRASVPATQTAAAQ